jgi:hypothetical protein
LAHYQAITPVENPLRQFAWYLLKVRSIFFALFLSSGIVLALFLWQGDLGFNLADEGFLWYGAQRVLQGEVPIRDFMAYDPGRYYWSAAWMALRGSDGIMTLREAAAVFQALGLFIGLALLVRYSVKQNALFWGLAAITLAVWMFPRHKLFDISLSIALVGALSYLVAHPTGRGYFLTGIVVGLVAIFGRNHGLYGLAAGLGVLAYLAIKRESGPGLIRALAAWSGGMLVGYLPLLIIIAVVPGFGSAFWESIRFLFEVRTTNLPLPVPFPWRVPFGQTTLIETVRGLLVGLFFLTIVAFGLAGLGWTIRRRWQNQPVSPALVASCFLTLPYAHFAYSRADVSHLAQGIFPFLIACLGIFSGLTSNLKWPAVFLLCGTGLLVMLPWHPGWQSRLNRDWVVADVSGNRLKIEPGTANTLHLIKQLAREFSPGKQPFIAAPYWPGAYAALDRKSPMWDIYPLFPRSESFQKTEIERIKSARPGFAIVLDHPLDGQEERRFRHTHPLVNQYINNLFERLDGYSNDPSFRIYKSKSAQP